MYKRQILDGTSLWLDKIGQQVASEKLSLKLAPLHPDIVAGQRFTSEGYIAEDYDMIERGVLKQFRLSDYAARKTGYERSPNSSFGCFIVEPVSYTHLLSAYYQSTCQRL